MFTLFSLLLAADTAMPPPHICNRPRNSLLILVRYVASPVKSIQGLQLPYIGNHHICNLPRNSLLILVSYVAPPVKSIQGLQLPYIGYHHICNLRRNSQVILSAL